MTTIDLYPDFAVRQAEGWDIFECGGSHPPYEIEKDDDLGLFEGDADAWVHVVREAAHGSRSHVNALAFLALYSPEELVGIFHYLFYGQYRTFMRDPCSLIPAEINGEFQPSPLRG